MLSPESCQERAQACRRTAEAVSDPRDRAKWLQLADEWTKLSSPRFRPLTTANKRQPQTGLWRGEFPIEKTN
jgi:hypothetical protein